MLSITTIAFGILARMRRVASIPLMPGSAQSITTTFGFNSRASRTASSPSLASPTTEIAASSSSMRRNPLRTSAWSSTSSTVSLSAMGLNFIGWHDQAHDRSTALASQNPQGSSHQFSALAHANQADTLMSRIRRKSPAAVLDFQVNGIDVKFQSHPRFLCSRVALHIIQRLLQHTIHLHSGSTIQRIRSPRFLIMYLQPGLMLDHWDVPIQGALESLFIEQHGMQCLRQ